MILGEVEAIGDPYIRARVHRVDRVSSANRRVRLIRWKPLPPCSEMTAVVRIVLFRGKRVVVCSR